MSRLALTIHRVHNEHNSLVVSLNHCHDTFRRHPGRIVLGFGKIQLPSAGLTLGGNGRCCQHDSAAEAENRKKSGPISVHEHPPFDISNLTSVDLTSTRPAR